MSVPTPSPSSSPAACARQAGELEPVEAAVAVGAIQRRAQPIGELARARGEHDQDAGAGRAAHQRGDEVDRRGIGPVDVVEDEHERARRGQPREQLAHRAMRPVALVLQQARPVIARGRDRRQHVRDLAERLVAQARQHPRVEARDVLVERVDEDPERQVALELGRAAVQDDAATGGRARVQLRQQPRLADARLALDQQRRRLAALERVEREVDGIQLSGAPYEALVDLGSHLASGSSITPRPRLGGKIGVGRRCCAAAEPRSSRRVPLPDPPSPPRRRVRDRVRRLPRP